MLKNYLVIAIRNILKNKLFAAINILGLAIGLSVFIFAQLFATYERNHDAFFPGAENIYAVYTDIRPEAGLGTQVLNATQSRVAPLMNNELTEMKISPDSMT